MPCHSMKYPGCQRRGFQVTVRWNSKLIKDLKRHNHQPIIIYQLSFPTFTYIYFRVKIQIWWFEPTREQNKNNQPPINPGPGSPARCSLGLLEFIHETCNVSSTMPCLPPIFLGIVYIYHLKKKYGDSFWGDGISVFFHHLWPNWALNLGARGSPAFSGRRFGAFWAMVFTMWGPSDVNVGLVGL